MNPNIAGLLRAIADNKIVVCEPGEWRIGDTIELNKEDVYLVFCPKSVIHPCMPKMTLKNLKDRKFKAVIVRHRKRDLFDLLKIGCSESKKSLHTKEHVTPIDIVERPYGRIIVTEMTRSKNAPDVRSGKKRGK